MERLDFQVILVSVSGYLLIQERGLVVFLDILVKVDSQDIQVLVVIADIRVVGYLVIVVILVLVLVDTQDSGIGISGYSGYSGSGTSVIVGFRTIWLFRIFKRFWLQWIFCSGISGYQLIAEQHKRIFWYSGPSGYSGYSSSSGYSGYSSTSGYSGYSELQAIQIFR